MPLIIETGVGVAGADSWVEEFDATSFWADRGGTDWVNATVPNREIALRKAADYLLYAYRYPGQPSTLVQRLPWPRSGVRSGRGYYPSGDIPTQIYDAQMLLARDALTQDILAKVANERQLIEETKAVKGISKSLKYATAPVDQVSGLRRFPVIDNMLRGIAIGSMGGDFAVVPLVRGR